MCRHNARGTSETGTPSDLPIHKPSALPLRRPPLHGVDTGPSQIRCKFKLDEKQTTTTTSDGETCATEGLSKCYRTTEKQTIDKVKKKMT